MTPPDHTLAARLDDLARKSIRQKITGQTGAVNYAFAVIEAYSTNQLITTAEADARVEAAVLAEREACATWHDREASAAMNSLHCGSENSEYRAANRLHDLHTASAAAIRSRGVTG